MMTPRRKEPRISLDARWLAFAAALVGLVYALNRPVEAFNSLSASVDKLAAAVSRIDLNQTEQGKRIDAQATDVAGLKATVEAQGAVLTTLEARINAQENKKK